MMNYKEFETTIKGLLEAAVGTNVNITPIETRKNNNTLYRGLAFQVPCSNVAESIYLESAYQAYESGIPISDICEEIYHTYKNPPLQSTDVDLSFDLKNVKDQIVYKLINYEQNKDLLKGIPHIPYLDLAIVFYLLLDINDNGIASMSIDNNRLAIWGIDTGTLYSYAKENTPKLLPANIKSMIDVIGEIDKELVANDIDSGMLIISNAYNNLGAGCILYDNVLKQLGYHLRENFYILPSSTHECIILPKSKAGSEAELTEMICEINQTYVDPHEVLADHPYYYDLQKETLELAA